MSSTTTTNETLSLPRILAEGYGPGAWHGPDLKAALADVTAAAAFRRPARGRHSIAEIALHHAYCVRAVRGQVSKTPLEPFLVPGEDWFDLDGKKGPGWDEVRGAVETEYTKLSAALESAGTAASGHAEVVLGITCHAVYHAGQIQLVKKLLG